MADARLNVLIKYSNQGNGLTQAVGGAKRLALQLGSVAGAYLSVRAAARGGADIIKLGADLQHLSAQTSTSVRGLAVLQQLFKDSGVDAGKVGQAINKMQKSLVEAGETASSEAGRGFKALGLDIEELLDLDPAEQFAEVSKAVANMEDPAQKTAAAMRIFGRSGAEMMAVFEQGDFDDSARSIGRMGAMLEENAEAFERIDTLVGRLPNKSRQLFVGIAASMSEELLQMFEALDRMDFTAIGERIGDTIRLAVQMGKEGTIGDLIRLSILAGMEEATEQAGKIWDAFWSAGFQAGLWSIIISLSTGIALSLIDGFAQAIAFLSASMRWVFDQARAEFGKTGAKLGLMTQRAMILQGGGNPAAMAQLDELEKKIDEEAGYQAKGFFDYLSEQQTGIAAFADPLKAGLEANERLSVAILHGKDAQVAANGEFAKGVSYRKQFSDSIAGVGRRLRDETEASKAKREALSRESDAVRGLSGEELELTKVRIEGLRFEREQLLQAGQKRNLTADEVSRIKELADAEKAALQTLIEYYTNLSTAAGASVIERQRAANMVQQLQATQDAVGSGSKSSLQSRYEKSRSNFNDSGNPFSLNHFQSSGEGFEAGLMDYATQIGTIGDQINEMTTGIAESMSSGIGGALNDLIQGTVTWQGFLNNVWSTISNSITGAITNMAAEWMTKRLAMFLLGEKLKAMDTAANVAKGATETAALAAPAMLTSITSFGGAAAAGLAGFVAAMSGFAAGGYTPDVGINTIAGVVHGGEHVEPAWMVTSPQFGPVIAMLEAARKRGYASGGSVGGSVPAFSGFGAPAVNLTVLSGDYAVKKHLRSSRGREEIIDANNQARVLRRARA